MKYQFLMVISLIGLLYMRTSLACETTDTTDPTDEDTTEDPATTAEDPDAEDKPDEVGDLAKACFGDEIEVSPLEEEAGACEKTDAESPEELKCDFESFSGACCFCNEPGESRKDQLDWVVAKGEHDHEKVEQCFGQGAVPPLGNFLVTYRSREGEQGDVAILKSCTICAAAGAPIKVTLKHWKLHGKIYACKNPNPFDAEATPTDCQQVTAEDFGPSTLTVPGPTEEGLVDVIIMGEAEDKVSVLGIDDVEVEYEAGSSCGGGGATTDGGDATDGGVSPADVCCDFEETCIWEPASPGEDGQGEDKWSIQEFKEGDKIGNRDTGVKKTSDGKPGKVMSVTISKENTYSVIKVENVKSIAGKTLKFNVYEATLDFVLEFCQNSLEDCEDVSNVGISLEDHENWSEAEVLIKEDTETIYLKCLNIEGYVGTCGVDNIVVDGEC